MSNTEIQDPVFRRFYSHLNSAVTILQSYDGRIPFAHFIKNYFSQHKKFGSKDRKQITHLCYGYFRLGKSYTQLSTEKKILKGLQLCTPALEKEWQSIINEYQLPQETPNNIFSLKEYISKSIDTAAFESAHLVQPDLFLRIRPGYERDVVDTLNAQKVQYRIDEGAIRLPNLFKIEDLFSINKEVVVQDLSSQRVGRLLEAHKSAIFNQKFQVDLWDCCAASGGKSILANDILKQMELTVSDIRPSIIVNLKKRFREAGIKNYHALVADATHANPAKQFDLIIADVPCSGSGTWARTPEQLLYFEPASMDSFVKLQSAITGNAIRYLKPGGYLLYITCSVFEKENEGQVSQLQNAGLQLLEQLVLKGYEQRADTMFAALMRAPL